MSDRAIHWSVTINNPKDDDEENIASARARGWTVEGQKEVGENGTPHYQLYVNTRTQQRFTALKKVFPRGHIEAARNPKAVKQYVHKEETRVAELPNSDKYVTSLTRFWELVVDELTDGDADKRHRICGDTLEPYHARFEPLKALNYAVDRLLRKGYYCVETMCVNPQTRSAWKELWQGIAARRELDRQTDRQDEIMCDTVNIPIYNADDDTTEDGEGEESGLSETCGEEDEDECSEDEGTSDGEGSEEDSE